MKELSLDKKKEIYLLGVQKILPQINISESFTMFSGDYPTSAKIEFKNSFISDFFNKEKHNTFIHYTSVAAFNGIINSASLRMYDCNNMNDPRELKEGMSVFDINLEDNKVDHFKKSHFIFSPSKFDLNHDKDEFLMWRLYGNEGKGVALVFEFENIETEFTGFFNGFIQYSSNSDKIKKLKEFISFHNDFQQKYQLFQNMPSLFANLSLYIKNNIWENENEFRILAYTTEKRHKSGQNHFLHSSREYEINKEGKMVSYVSLPLNFENIEQRISHFDTEMKKSYLEMIPKLKLRKVICGYQIQDEFYYNLVDFISEIVPNKLGYPVDIQQSNLKEYFK